jgi:hypothetical protein
VEIVDDETVLREEDELGISAQDATEEKQVGRWNPAVAGGCEGGVPAAAETTWESSGYACSWAIDI